MDVCQEQINLAIKHRINYVHKILYFKDLKYFISKLKNNNKFVS